MNLPQNQPSQQNAKFGLVITLVITGTDIGVFSPCRIDLNRAEMVRKPKRCHFLLCDAKSFVFKASKPLSFLPFLACFVSVGGAGVPAIPTGQPRPDKVFFRRRRNSSWHSAVVGGQRTPPTRPPCTALVWYPPTLRAQGIIQKIQTPFPRPGPPPRATSVPPPTLLCPGGRAHSPGRHGSSCSPGWGHPRSHTPPLDRRNSGWFPGGCVDGLGSGDAQNTAIFCVFFWIFFLFCVYVSSF